MAGTLRRYSEDSEGADETVIQPQEGADTVIQELDEELDFDTQELSSTRGSGVQHDTPTMTLALDALDRDQSPATEEHTLEGIEPRKPLTRSARSRKDSSAGMVVKSRLKQTIMLASGITLGLAACLSAIYLYKNTDLNEMSFEKMAASVNIPEMNFPEVSLPEISLPDVSLPDLTALTGGKDPAGTQQQTKPADEVGARASLTTPEQQGAVENSAAISKAPLVISTTAADPELADANVVTTTEAPALALQNQETVPTRPVAEPGNTTDFVKSKPVEISKRRFLHFKNSYRAYGPIFADAPSSPAEISQSNVALPALSPTGKNERWKDAKTGTEWQSGWEIDRPEQNLKLGDAYIKYLKKNGAGSDLKFKSLQNRPSNFLGNVDTSGTGPSSATRYTQ